MVEPYLNQVGGKVDNDVNLFTGGIDAYTDKGFLEANVMPYAVNMTMTKPPQIRTRGRRMSIAARMQNDKWASNIGEIVELITYNEKMFFAIVERSGVRKVVKIYRQYNDSTETYSPNFSVDDMMDIPKVDRYYHTIARQATTDYIYISGAGTNAFKVKISISWGGTGHRPPTPVITPVEDTFYGILCFHKGRLFIGDPVSNIVTFSALYDFDNFDKGQVYRVVEDTLSLQVDNSNKDVIYLVPNEDGINYDKYKYVPLTNVWAPDGQIPKGSIIVDTTTGMSLPDYSTIAGDFKVTNSYGELVSLKSFDDKLMIFCEHSMHCMYGDTPDVTMQNQFQLVDLNNNLGAKSEKCVAIGGGKLFWLGDNNEVYEYTGAAINIISRPGKTRNSTLAIGGISGLIDTLDIHEGLPTDTDNSYSKFVATSDHLYINTWNAHGGTFHKKYLFVFDTYNRTWWAEDGEFNTIGNFSDYDNKILLGKDNGDILISNEEGIYYGGYDTLYDFEQEKLVDEQIKYEFHTRVYGADGVDMRKTLSNVWFQARATADVYIDDRWTSADDWDDIEPYSAELVKIGTLKNEYQPAVQKTSYLPNTYEQQLCIVPKMYGERLNAFQVIVKGEGAAIFYLMKREWRAR